MATRPTRRRKRSNNSRPSNGGQANERRSVGGVCVSASAPLAPQPLRFGPGAATDAALGAKGETDAAISGLAAFGLRASRLPCRWDLAILFSCQRRPAPQRLKRVAPLRAASIAAAEERHGCRISRLVQNSRGGLTPFVAVAKTCTWTYAQYIYSLREETSSTFPPRPKVRRRIRDELSGQKPLDSDHVTRSTPSLVDAAGRAPAARGSGRSTAERVLRLGFARRRPLNDVRPIGARTRR